MGRPPTPPEEQRTLPVMVLLTEAEKQELKTGCETAGRKMGDVLREGGFRLLRRLLRDAQPADAEPPTRGKKRTARRTS